MQNALAKVADFYFRVNDIVLSANGIPLDNVDYSTAVQVLRECGQTVKLTIKRRVNYPPYDLVKVTLTKNNKKDGKICSNNTLRQFVFGRTIRFVTLIILPDFGLVLGNRLYIKEIKNRNLIDKDSSIAEGDVIVKVRFFFFLPKAVKQNMLFSAAILDQFPS